MRELRQFNSQGVLAVEAAWLRAKAEPVDFGPLLEDPQLTGPVAEGATIEVRAFEDRFDAASFLYEALEPWEGLFPSVERAKGLWTWLAIAWVDILAPADTAGLRRMQALPRWVAMVDEWNIYYRHLLAGPYRIYRAHRDNPERVRAVLATAVNRPGDVVEALASRQEIITNASLMQAATMLYVDASGAQLKTGAARKERGGARRLADMFQQFDLTWDFYAMAPEQILELLPAEFDEFR